MKETESRKVVKIDYHRNGICGIGFHVGIVEDQECGRMLVVRFNREADKDTGGVVCAAFNLDELAKGVIEFGHNSYRGDHFHDVMDAAIEQHNKELDKKLSAHANKTH